MYLLLLLVAPLPFPSSVVTISPPSIIILVVAVVLAREFAPTAVVVVVFVHPVPSCCCCCWWRSLELRTLASRRMAGRGVTRIAILAECAKEADLTRVDLCLCLRALLRSLHLDDENQVALAVLLSFRVDNDVLDWVVVLEDGSSARALHLMHTTCGAPPKSLCSGRIFFSCISCATSS